MFNFHMKVGFFVVLMLAAATHGVAQKMEFPTDSISADSVKTFKKPQKEGFHRYGFWLAAFAEPSSVSKASGTNLGIGLSFVFKQQYHIGAYGNVFQGEYTERLIFPNEFSMKYGHAGLWTGYKTHLKKVIDFTGDIKLGQGKVFWERTDNFYNMFEDYALFIQPSVGIDWKILSFVALHTEVGYQQVKGLSIPELSDKDFSGMTFNFMIKVGLF